MTNHKTILPVLLVVLSSVRILPAQTRADFFLLADPSVYTIYNSYQQPLSAEERNRFVRGAPLRIIEKDVVLGDQISRALKFDFNGELFYLVREEKDAFAGEKNRSNRTLLTGCELLGDTVELLTTATRVISLSGKNLNAGKGDRLQRVFRTSGRYYVRVLDGKETAFGWSALEPKIAWKPLGSGKAAARAADTLLPASLKERVERRMEQANESYREAFSHFNTLTRDEKSVPRWQCERSPAGMTWTFVGPYRNTAELAGSTRYLEREIETILLGSGFQLSTSDGAFHIKRKIAEY